MALINCPECGNRVSDQAQVCTNCGYPISELVNKNKEEKRATLKRKIIGIILAAVVGTVGGVAVTCCIIYCYMH